MSQKPEITQKEANWQVHVAGIQASAQTEATGIDIATATHLLDAGVGIHLKGVTFPPITAGFLMMLPLIEALRSKIVSLSQEGGQLACLAFCLGEPAVAWQTLRKDDGGKTFEAASFDYAQQFSLADLRALARWMTKQMADLNEAGEDPAPGKPLASEVPLETSQS